jgi:hypothetical protein
MTAARTLVIRTRAVSAYAMNAENITKAITTTLRIESTFDQ